MGAGGACAEVEGGGKKLWSAAVLAAIQAGGGGDYAGAIAPLIPAADAGILDTTRLDIEAAGAAARAIVERRRRG